MSFTQGTLTIARLTVLGDAPKASDPSILDKLHEHRFKESDLVAPDDVEIGFGAGGHLYDDDFTYEKCCFGTKLLFAVRIDTHKAPADVKKAYRQINEEAFRKHSPTNHVSKAERSEALELANHQVGKDAAAGKFRRTKVVPVVWDLTISELWIGQASSTVHDLVARLMHESFGVTVQEFSSGMMAKAWARKIELHRDLEYARPTSFTAPPPMSVSDDDHDNDHETDTISALPSTPWTQKSVDVQDFLGNEAAIWAWYQTEKSDEPIIVPGGEVQLVFDPVLEMECAWGVTGKQTLKGDGPTQLPEAAKALSIGKWPRKVGLLLTNQEKHWALAWQADRHVFTGIRLPEPEESISTHRELVEQRLKDAAELMKLMDGLLKEFLEHRLSPHWPRLSQEMGEWIASFE